MMAIGIPVAAAIIAAALALPARADQLRICFEEWQPFSAMVDGKPVGLMIDIMDRALAAAGHRATYRQQPYQRCIGNVRSGTFDAMLMTSGEQGFVPTTVSAAFWEVGVIAAPDWPHDSYASLDDFAGITVGLVDAYIYPPAVEAAKATWNVAYVPDALFNLRKASSGRIDITIADIPWTQLQAAREGLRVKILSPALFATPQYTYFHPDRADVAAAVDEAIRELIADGTMDRLYADAVGTTFEEVKARAAKAKFPE